MKIKSPAFNAGSSFLRPCALIFLLLFGALSAQHPLNTGNIIEEQYLEKIPFEYRDGFMIVDVDYNGEKAKFLFDTGASNVLFGDKVEGTSKSAVVLSDSNANTASAEVLFNQKFKIGDLEFTEMNFILFPGENILKTCFAVKGIIGANSFRNSVVQINYGTREITVTDAVSKLNTRDYQRMNMVPNRGGQVLPYVYFDYQASRKIEVAFLLDSGFSGAVHFSKEAKDLIGKFGGIAETEKGYGFVSLSLIDKNENEDLERVRLKNPLMFANTSFINEYIVVTKDHNSKIGNKILEKLNPIFDFRKSQVYFLTKEDQLTGKKENVSVISDGIALRIAALWGPAAEKAKPGDTVTEIEGQSPEILSRCESLKQKEKLLSGKSKMKVRSQVTGQTIQLEIR